MKNCSLPTRKECFDILALYNVPPHIVKHCRVVAKVAVFLVQKLKEKGFELDVELVDRACLLHDVMRMCDTKESDFHGFMQGLSEEDKLKWGRLGAKYRGMPHEYAAFDILKQKYPALALTVRKHRYMGLLSEQDKPETWEEKIVYYADKRVMHEKIVSLQERLDEGHKRNYHQHGSEAQSRKNTAMVDPLIFQMEQEISKAAGFDAAGVTEKHINPNSNKDAGE